MEERQTYPARGAGAQEWFDGEHALPVEAHQRTRPQIKALPRNTSRRSAYLRAKRAFDIVSSAALLLVTWPIFLVLALLIKLDSKGPVIFAHNRMGQYGKPIRLLKFRTMVTDAEQLIECFTPEQMAEWKTNYKLTNDPRITRIGRVLRKTSLDELPQIVNILLGELSVCGPRPVIEDELQKYGDAIPKFISVRPGLTGYWQAYARSDCSYEERMKMELEYIDKACFSWDMKIIFRTIITVVQGRGAI